MAINKSMMAAIREAAEAEYPNESCGLFVKVGKKVLTVVCRNVANDPRADFVLSPADYAKAADAGEVMGVWHTHIEQSSHPSQADRASCNNSGLKWYIVSVHKTPDGFALSDPLEMIPDDSEMPYIERPYAVGVFDCFSLVRDYYRREFGVLINDYPRIEEDGTKGYTKFRERFPAEGFRRLIDVEPEVGDIFVLQMGDEQHLAIYVGNDRILHHSRDRFSREDMYGGMWTKHTILHLRHGSRYVD